MTTEYYLIEMRRWTGTTTAYVRFSSRFRACPAQRMHMRSFPPPHTLDLPLRPAPSIKPWWGDRVTCSALLLFSSISAGRTAGARRRWRMAAPRRWCRGWWRRAAGAPTSSRCSRTMLVRFEALFSISHKNNLGIWAVNSAERIELVPRAFWFHGDQVDQA